jgi:hypothetical protein
MPIAPFAYRLIYCLSLLHGQDAKSVSSFSKYKKSFFGEFCLETDTEFRHVRAGQKGEAKAQNAVLYGRSKHARI